MDGLSFADFAFEDVDAERIENFFLNRAAKWTRAVDRIVTFTGKQRFGRIGKIERDLLLFESFGQAAKLNLNDLFQIVFARPFFIKEPLADLLDRIERQVVGVARHVSWLRASGQHLKRGVLLHGPTVIPGSRA